MVRSTDGVDWRRVGLLVGVLVTPSVVLGGGLWALSVPLKHAISPDAPVCVSTTVVAPDRDSFTTVVLNASDNQGEAAKVAKDLTKRGFAVGEAGNDRGGKAVDGVGQVRYGKDGLDQALVVQKVLLPGARLVQDGRLGTGVDLVLGPKFTNLNAPDAPLVFRNDVTVNVYNTTYFMGLATKASEKLNHLGFRTGDVGVDPKHGWVTDVAAIRYGPDGLLHAQLLQRLIPRSTLVSDPSTKGTTVDLLIGMKWTGMPDAPMTGADVRRVPPPKVSVTRPCP